MLTEHPQFFTATILEWKHLLKPDKYKDIVMQSLQFLVSNKRILLYGFVIMPNHIHLIWQMQENSRQADVQRDFLKYTAQQIKFDLQQNHPAVLEKFRVQVKDRAYQIWEHRPLSVPLWSKLVFDQKLNYIHQNPVQEKWQLADLPENYYYSSARYYLLNQDDWGFMTHYAE
ncbi:MAG: transposase [Cytophagales bacterium CG18_big_fil_WC_8_21_14_2_50_42_9]|nr:MAG: transposase [Cytophagales bacterium CG18_big_fil_WC_8_21_14_2_50_42_9]